MTRKQTLRCLSYLAQTEIAELGEPIPEEGKISDIDTKNFILVTPNAILMRWFQGPYGQTFKANIDAALARLAKPVPRAPVLITPIFGALAKKQEDDKKK